MKISIIVPTLDGRVPESLRRATENCAESELVVVKGVSPVGRARNLGLDRAKGEYVAWVDSDDEVTADWLPSILAEVKGNGPDLVTFDAVRVGWDVREPGIVWGEREPTVERLMRSVYQDLERMCSMWLFVVKRRLWEGLRFDEHAVICEDYLVLPRLVGRAKTLVYVPKGLYHYVCNDSSLVHRYGFTGEARVMELKRRRTDAAPVRYRSAAALGMAVAYYSVAIRVACGFAVVEGEEWRREAGLSRQFARRSFVRIAGEVLFRTRLPLREKAKWIVRFVWNCLPGRVGQALVRKG